MDLSLRQLSVHVAVARTGSFTEAARDLRVAQSSLSRTVLGTERALGVRLFDRTTRRVVCTPEGDELLAVAERVLAVHRAEMTGLERFLGGSRGTVTVATLPSVAASLLPPVIARFRERAPEVDVRILDGMSRTALERLVAGECDLALAVAESVPEDLRARALFQDRFYAVLPSGHRWAGSDHLRWRDLAEERFIAIGTDSSVRAGTEFGFARAGVRPARTIEAGTVSTVGGLLAADLGVSALPSLVGALMSFADHVRVPLVEPVVDRRLSVVTHRHRRLAPAAQALLRLLGDLRAQEHPLPEEVSWAGGAG
ncbi:LysR substrate-binding domain-containing protein [Nocardiopsis aegyptia]|uniref:LysR family transcriptional regulator n=1 Tax=Nocardiopsis aegyptia TaxID=220378 RepID=UPI003671D465